MYDMQDLRVDELMKETKFKAASDAFLSSMCSS